MQTMPAYVLISRIHCGSKSISNTAHVWCKSDQESNNSIDSEETETTLLCQRQWGTLQTLINAEPLVFDFQAVSLLE